MVEENVVEKGKSVALTAKTHARLIDLKSELKITKMDALLDKLITEYEQNRK